MRPPLAKRRPWPEILVAASFLIALGAMFMPSLKSTPDTQPATSPARPVGDSPTEAPMLRPGSSRPGSAGGDGNIGVQGIQVCYFARVRIMLQTS